MIAGLILVGALAAAGGSPERMTATWRADESKGRQTHWTLPEAAFVGNGDLGLVNGGLSAAGEGRKG